MYLSDEEAEALRRTSIRTGRSQSDLIREGIRWVGRPGKRKFHSMGAGRGLGGTTPTWDADGLYRKVMGKDQS